MEALRKKRNSSQGATILMALLFLLVCMMVGASILMAAASNAGKIRSNREEQQRYFTLSSALTLLCDELESVEYVGTYSYARLTEEIGDVGGNTVTHTTHTYIQQEGKLRKSGSGGNPEWSLKTLLPLYNNLDVVFADNFELKLANPVDTYVYEKYNADKINGLPKGPYTVTLKAGVDADTYGGLSEPVEIKAVVDANGGIVLTASLKNHPEYIMEAVLKPTVKLSDVLILATHTTSGPYETDPVQWKLDYIVKKGA